VHAGEQDHARRGWTTSRREKDSLWKSQSEWQRIEINGESRPTTNHGVANPRIEDGYRTEQNKNALTHRRRGNRQNCDYCYYYCYCCICMWLGLERTISMWLTAVEFVEPVSTVVPAITDYGCWYTQTGRVTAELLNGTVATTRCIYSHSKQDVCTAPCSNWSNPIT